MGIRNEEERLFAEWEKHRSNLVKDGVVDEKAYLESNPKLLFVMKEVNDTTGGGWDLRQFIREGAIGQTWNNVTRWVYGIRNLNKDIEWSSIPTGTAEKRRELLNSICAMNLKKSPGRGRTDNKKLEQAVAEDKEYLKQQFAFYDPNIIICCGSVTGDLFCRFILSETKPEPKMTKRGIPFHQLKSNQYLISFYHPQAIVLGCLLYYGLIDAVREILLGCVRT